MSEGVVDGETVSESASASCIGTLVSEDTVGEDIASVSGGCVFSGLGALPTPDTGSGADPVDHDG